MIQIATSRAFPLPRNNEAFSYADRSGGSPHPNAGSQDNTGLLFALEVSEPPPEPTKDSLYRLQQQLVQIQALTRLLPGYPAELRADVLSFRTQILREEEEERVDCIVLASRLAAVGYDVVCRRALGAGPSASPGTAPGACFRLLQYEFLVVKCAKGDFQGLELFVDACFREQFQIPHPTPHYAQLLAAVPEVFVGSRVHLITLVELLCAEMAQSFVERGLTVAPWRRTSAMLSKWLPVHAKDTPFATTSVFHAPPPAEDVWLPFGAEGAGSPRPSAPQQQQQQPQPQQEQQPASTCPFAEVRRRREQEDLARQMATLAAWCSMQASPRCITSIVAPAATAQAGKAATATDPASAAAPGCNTFAATTAAAGGSAAVAPADCSACAAAGNAIDPGPPFPTSPRSESSSSCSSSSSSGGRRTSLLSTQLHQQVVAVPSPVCICAARGSQPALHKVQFVQH